MFRTESGTAPESFFFMCFSLLQESNAFRMAVAEAKEAVLVSAFALKPASRAPVDGENTAVVSWSGAG